MQGSGMQMLSSPPGWGLASWGEEQLFPEPARWGSEPQGARKPPRIPSRNAPPWRGSVCAEAGGMHSSVTGFLGGRGPGGWGTGKGHPGPLYLVDAELPLEAAARPVVQRDLHGVVDVPHFVPAHLILDVQSDHCRTQGEERVTDPQETERGPPLLRTPPSSIPRTGGAGPSRRPRDKGS